MKLLSFRRDGQESWGAVSAGGIIDLGARLRPRFPTLQRLIAADGLQEAAAWVAREAPDVAESEIEFLPPIGDPDKIIALQLNYRAHIEELRAARIDIAIPDAYPSFFMRPKGSHVGHRQSIVKPPESNKFDFEGELAVIIGRRCRRVPREAALAVVAGYACYNEGSMRDWQMRAPQLGSGKMWERSGGFGPWIATSEEIGDPANLRLRTFVNGELRQDAAVSDLLFDVPFLISYLSAITSLDPGDVIVTGTPGRIGGLMQRFLSPGDRVDVEISRVGRLTNQVVAEATDLVPTS
jgi:2-keto-4-pentenoate hydratase/2-oxohepta-3-ene-1,7-dioic acid hydratase in catechol pathway